MKYVENLIRDQQILIIDNMEKSCYFHNISAFCKCCYDNTLRIVKYSEVEDLIFVLSQQVNNSKQILASRCEYDSKAEPDQANAKYYMITW